MKKVLFTLLSIFALCTAAEAAPGDTTWISANHHNLDGYGSYDSTVIFPSGVSYRRIYMIFTLGKHTCPGYTYGTGSVPWCGDWDYTVQNYLLKTNGERFELGRFITPYANGGAPRTPYTWTQRYVYDVTDYAAKLQDTCLIRIFYSGYSGGFTSDIKFALIEGTPDRNVLDIKRLWGGSWAYGDTSRSDSNNINVHFPPVTETAPTGTQLADLKFTVTGHGADANYCSEFCSHNYQVLLNGTPVSTRTIWRSDCGKNQLWPQSGTWLYDRGNWCPGAIVYSHHNILTGVTGGSTFSTSVAFDYYVSSGGASYTNEGTLIYYGAMNKTVDATLEDVISPTNDENHFRENPICGRPTIHIKNTGSTTITTMDISYGVSGMGTATYTWTGSLASLDETDVVLPELFDLRSVSGGTAALTFNAEILTVNGAADADATNNKMQTQFIPGPVLPVNLRLYLKTNNEPVSTGSTISETSWVIYDMNNTVVASRVNANISTTYNDTLTLGPACYKLVVYDSGCNGLYWWANPTGTTGGAFGIRKMSGVNIPLHGYSTGGTYPHDFGCEYVAYFYTNWPTGITELYADEVNMDIYPNPAQNQLNIDLEGMHAIDGTIRIYDAIGRMVIEQKCTDAHPQINTAQLTNGIYSVQFTDNTNIANRLVSRIAIAK